MANHVEFCLKQSYLNDLDNRGILSMEAEQFFEVGRQAVNVGLSLTGYAIGDRALHKILNGFEQLRAYESRRIEHVQILHKDDAWRLGGLSCDDRTK